MTTLFLHRSFTCALSKRQYDIFRLEVINKLWLSSVAFPENLHISTLERDKITFRLYNIHVPWLSIGVFRPENLYEYSFEKGKNVPTCVTRSCIRDGSITTYTQHICFSIKDEITFKLDVIQIPRLAIAGSVENLSHFYNSWESPNINCRTF